MEATRGAALQDCDFDGSTITVRIPMTWKRHGGRKVIIAPDNSDAGAPAKPRPDETLIRALARAHRWKRLLEEGRYRSAGELAEAERVTRSFVNRLLRLTLWEMRLERAGTTGLGIHGLRRNAVRIVENRAKVESRQCTRVSFSSSKTGHLEYVV
jgi:hypothetical protein